MLHRFDSCLHKQNMKHQIQQLVSLALESMAADGMIPEDQVPHPVIERARDSLHGDFACNVAMVLAKVAGRSPRELAQRLVDRLPRIPIGGKGGDRGARIHQFSPLARCIPFAGGQH